MMFNNSKLTIFYSVVLALLLAVAGCSGGSSKKSVGGASPGPIPTPGCNPGDPECPTLPTPTITPTPSPIVTSKLQLQGYAVKGPWTNSDVSLRSVDASKLDLTGDVLDSGTTNDQAQVEGIDANSDAGIFIFEAKANSGTRNINNNAAPVLQTLRTLVTSEKLLEGSRIATFANPVTTMALNIAGTKIAAKSSEAEIIEEVRLAGALVAQKLGFGLLDGIDILDTPVVAINNDVDLLAAANYRTAIEAIGVVIADLMRLTGQSGDAILNALSDDIGDGELDFKRRGSTIGVFGGLIAEDYFSDIRIATLLIPNTDRDEDPTTGIEPYTIDDVEALMANELVDLGISGVDTSGLTNGAIDVTPGNVFTDGDCDRDGIEDSAEVDDDDDGWLDSNDDFPCDPNEWLDTDGDRIGNNADPDDDNDGIPDDADICPLDADDETDTDGDRICDNQDADDDNDLVLDGQDAFPKDRTEWEDSDGDGIGNNADTDDDNDGTPDTEDGCPLDPDDYLDLDKDGICDSKDSDIDDDGVPNTRDACPRDRNDSVDTDDDGLCNNADPDDDNDTYLDNDDAFPLNPNLWFDCEEVAKKAKPGDDVGHCPEPTPIPSPTPTATPTPTAAPSVTPKPTVPPDPAPVAAFSFSPDAGDTSTEFTFDASNSTDDKPGLTYRWQFEPGTPWTSYSQSPVTPPRSYAFAGTKTVTLQVKASNGATTSISQPLQVVLDPNVENTEDIDVKIKLDFPVADYAIDKSDDEIRRDRLYAIDEQSNAMHVVNLLTGLLEKTLTFVCKPQSIAQVGPDRLAISMNKASFFDACPGNSVAIIDLDTMALVDVEGEPDLIAMSNKVLDLSGYANTLVVSYGGAGGDSHGIRAFHVTTGKEITAINPLQARTESGFRFAEHPNDDWLYVGNSRIAFEDATLSANGVTHHIKTIVKASQRPSGSAFAAPAFAIEQNDPTNTTQMITPSGKIYNAGETQDMVYLDRMTVLETDRIVDLGLDQANNLIATLENSTLASDEDDWVRFYRLGTQRPLFYEVKLAAPGSFLLVHDTTSETHIWAATFDGTSTLLRRVYNPCPQSDSGCSLPENFDAAFSVSVVDGEMVDADTGDSFVFDVSESLAANPKHRVRWDVANDGIYETLYSRDPALNWIFHQPGEKTVTLQIVGEFGDIEKTEPQNFTIDFANDAGESISGDVANSFNFRISDHLISPVTLETPNPQAGELYVTSAANTSLVIANLVSGEEEHRFELHCTPKALALDVPGQRLYVAMRATGGKYCEPLNGDPATSEGMGYVAVINLETRQKINEFPIQIHAREMVFHQSEGEQGKLIISGESPEQRLDVYATQDVNGPTDRLQSVTDLVYKNATLTLSQTDDLLYVNNHRFEVTATGLGLRTDSVVDGTAPAISGRVYTSPDGQYVITANGAVYDADMNYQADKSFSPQGAVKHIYFDELDDADVPTAFVYTLQFDTNKKRYTRVYNLINGQIVDIEDLKLSEFAEFAYIHGSKQFNIVMQTGASYLSGGQEHPCPDCDPDAVLGPTAEFTVLGADYETGQRIIFDATNSTATAGSGEMRYQWDFNGDGVFEVEWSDNLTDPIVTWSYHRSGERTVRLKVTDQFGQTSATVEDVLTIAPAADTGDERQGSQTDYRLPFRVTDAIMDPVTSRQRLFVTDSASRKLHVVDLTRGRIIREFSFECVPGRMAIDDNELYVSLKPGAGASAFCESFSTDVPDKNGFLARFVLSDDAAVKEAEYKMDTEADDLLILGDNHLAVNNVISGVRTETDTVQLSTEGYTADKIHSTIERAGAAFERFEAYPDGFEDERWIYLDQMKLVVNGDYSLSNPYVLPGRAIGSVFAAPEGDTLLSTNGTLHDPNRLGTQRVITANKVIDVAYDTNQRVIFTVESPETNTDDYFRYYNRTTKELAGQDKLLGANPIHIFSDATSVYILHDYASGSSIIERRGHPCLDCDDNPPPNAVLTITPAQGGSTSTVYSLDASASDIGESSSNTGLAAIFDWDGDGGYSAPYFDNLTVEHTFKEPGTRNVTVKVRDDRGWIDTADIAFVVLPENGEFIGFVDFTPADIEVDDYRERLYISDPVSNALHILSPTTGAALFSPIDFGSNTPGKLAMSPDGSRLYVTHYNNLNEGSYSVYTLGLTTESTEPVKSHDVALPFEPRDIVHNGDNRLILTGEQSDTGRVFLYDATSGTQVGASVLAYGYRIALHPDGDAVYVNQRRFTIAQNNGGLVAGGSNFTIGADLYTSVNGNWVLGMNGKIYDAIDLSEVRSFVAAGTTVLSIHNDQRNNDGAVIDNGIVLTIERLASGRTVIRAYNPFSMEYLTGSEFELDWDAYGIMTMADQVLVRRVVEGAVSGTDLFAYAHPCPVCDDNEAPTADFTLDVASGQPFIFSARASSDKETADENLEYAWDWDGDGSFELKLDTANMEVDSPYAYGGTKTIVLEVRDVLGLTDKTDPRTVEVPFNDEIAKAFETQFETSAWTFDPVGKRLFLVNKASDDIVVVNLDTGFIDETIEVKDCQPDTLIFDGGGNRLFASKRLACAPLGDPGGVASLFISEIDLGSGLETKRHVHGRLYDKWIFDMAVVDDHLVALSRLYFHSYSLTNFDEGDQVDLSGAFNVFMNLAVIEGTIYSHDWRFTVATNGDITSASGGGTSRSVFAAGSGFLIDEDGGLFLAAGAAPVNVGNLPGELVRSVHANNDGTVFVVVTANNRDYLRHYRLNTTGPLFFEELAEFDLGPKPLFGGVLGVFAVGGDVYTLRSVNGSGRTIMQTHTMAAP